MFGVTPWRLQVWPGHKRIDETMLYVHVAENHRREIPERIVPQVATSSIRIAGSSRCAVRVAAASSNQSENRE